jgi:hypothetical protein
VHCSKNKQTKQNKIRCFVLHATVVQPGATTNQVCSPLHFFVSTMSIFNLSFQRLFPRLVEPYDDAHGYLVPLDLAAAVGVGTAKAGDDTCVVCFGPSRGCLLSVAGGRRTPNQATLDCPHGPLCPKCATAMCRRRSRHTPLKCPLCRAPCDAYDLGDGNEPIIVCFCSPHEFHAPNSPPEGTEVGDAAWLRTCCSSGWVELALQSLEHGANPAARNPRTGLDAIGEAVWGQQLDVVIELVRWPVVPVCRATTDALEWQENKMLEQTTVTFDILDVLMTAADERLDAFRRARWRFPTPPPPRTWRRERGRSRRLGAKKRKTLVVFWRPSRTETVTGVRRGRSFRAVN